jgi:hypothetical protein
MCKKNQTFSGSGIGMKWHKFLLILLWLGAALNIVSGIGYLLGDLYGEYTAEIYAAAPTLATFDLACGGVMILFGLFQFVMRGRLKRMCKNGPALLSATYIMLIIINLVTAVVPAFLAPQYLTVDTPTVMGTIFGNILWLSVNSSYYKKRMDMFTE